MAQNAYPPQYERWPNQEGAVEYGPPPPKRSNRKLWVIFGLMVLVVLGLTVAVGASLSHDSKPKTTASTHPAATATASRPAAAAQPPTATTKAVPKPVTVADGTWEVGSEVKPGTYTTVANADGAGCYWARLRNFDGDVNSINDNGNLSPGAHGRIVVKATDKGVEFSGGCVWVRK